MPITIKKSILLIIYKILFSPLFNHIFASRIYKNDWAQKLFHSVTRATKILLFYNYLPDKRLKFKPNLNKNECFELKQTCPRFAISNAVANLLPLF